MKALLFFSLTLFVTKATAAECVRLLVQPSSICENLKVTPDYSKCTQKPVFKNQRIECKNEFFAEYIVEKDTQTLRAQLTKNADGTWSAGQLEVVERAAAAPEVVPTKSAPAPSQGFEYWAEFRIRAENDRETNLTSNRSPTHLRLRPGIEWKVQPKLSLVVEAQAVKQFGSESYVGSSATANTRARTSGQNYDQEVSLHQGHIKYLINDDLQIRLGRGILDYGDSLVIGRLDWGSYGRSFDMAALRWKHAYGWADGFTAKIVDRSITSDRPGNEDLSGVYLHFDLGQGLSNVEPYVFNYQDSTNLDSAGNSSTSRMYEIWAYGLRLKSNYESADYRAEYTKQTASVSANQIDIEVGWMLPYQLRVAGEYFDADEDYNQLYPTGHGRFGLADIFSRRNIQGEALKVQAKLNDVMEVSGAWWWLNRHSENKAAYLYDGTSAATSSTEKILGQELDIEVKYQIEKELQLLLGFADFYAGRYITDQYAGIDPLKWYLQVSAKF